MVLIKNGNLTKSFAHLVGHVWLAKVSRVPVNLIDITHVDASRAVAKAAAAVVVAPFFVNVGPVVDGIGKVLPLVGK